MFEFVWIYNKRSRNIKNKFSNKISKIYFENTNTNYYNKLLQKLKVIYDDFILEQNNAISDINIIFKKEKDKKTKNFTEGL